MDGRTPPQHVLLFGDQTTEVRGPIRALTKSSRNSSQLAGFLAKATATIQQHVFKLSRNSATNQNLGDLEALAESVSTSGEVLNDLVIGVLLYVVRIGNLILLAENDPSILGRSDSDVYIVGLCTGLIPATVAASTESVEDVVRVGLEVLPVMIRLLVELDRRSQEIQESHDAWSYTVAGFTEERESALDAFNKAQSLPEFRRIYVSVRGETWATLTGPPTVMARLWSSPSFKGCTKMPLPIGFAPHAPHLPALNSDYIIGESKTWQTQLSKNSHILLEEDDISGCSLRSALQMAVQKIGQDTLHIPQVIDQLVSELSDDSYKPIFVSAVDPTRQLSFLEKMLKKADIAYTTHVSEDGNYNPLSDSIAIVGMSGRFPGGNSVKELWDTLTKGLATHERIPASRFNLDDFYDADLSNKNSMTATTGCFIDKPGVFDPSFFNISPREAMQMDPQQRLLLLSTYEALEVAGYSPERTPSSSGRRIATYFGQVTDDWREINEQQGLGIYHIPGTMRIFAPGRLNYFFKWEGGSYSLDTACSGSSTAIHLACKALVDGECDTALAGGGTVHASPMTFVGLSRGGFLSPGHGCNVFSAEADGYGRGDGVGVLVLKRLSDAIAENDNIHAVISATARNHSAYAKSITHPHSETQQRLYQAICKKAGISPTDISYVEMHGTGTQAGDSTEMDSVSKMLATSRSSNNPLYVGGIKANVGHGEAAAGVTSIMKAIMMFKDGVIPPQAGMAQMKLNPKFGDLAAKNIIIARRETPFTTGFGSDKKRRILVNNFDAAGGNTSILLQEPPQAVAVKPDDPRSYHTVALSAKSVNAIKNIKLQLLARLKSDSSIKLGDLAYTTTARRMHHDIRAAFMARTPQELVQQIQASLEKNAPQPSAQKLGKTVFVFTGQGSHYWGMGSALFESNALFRDSVLACQRICNSLGWPDFVDIIRGDGMLKPEDSASFLSTKNTLQVQLAVVSLEIALAKLWRSWGVHPDLVMGHSLGEYVALHVAGVLSMSDTLFAVGTRASLVQEKCVPNTYAMLAVANGWDAVKEQLEQHPAAESLSLACLNGPKGTVVSGPIDDIESLQAQLKSNAIGSTKLNLQYGFHSAQLDPILKEYETSLEGITFSKPVVPVLSTMLASVISEHRIFSPMYLAAQMRQPVLFLPALEKARANGLALENTQWLEIGPTPTCIKFVRAALTPAPSKMLKTLESGRPDWSSVSDALAVAYTNGTPVDWVRFHTEYEQSLSLLTLPAYPFDLKDFWAPYETKSAVVEEPAMVRESETNGGIIQLPSSTLQRAHNEDTRDGVFKATFQSQTAEQNLLRVIQNHVVNDYPICPASGFCDMALTAAKYCWQKKLDLKPTDDVPAMTVTHLEITNPIVVFEEIRSHYVQVTATMSMNAKDSVVEVSFASNAKGENLMPHGSCKVVVGKPTSTKSLPDVHLIRSRVEVLTGSSRMRSVDRLPKAVVYKLFSELVKYGPEYRGMQEVFTDPDVGDSVARIRLGETGGQFIWNPFWMDALIHISGFVLNGDPAAPEDAAFVATGFETIELIGQLEADKDYLSYTHMRPNPTRKGIFNGDVYVFDGDELVAICLNIKFISSKRAALRAAFEHSTPKGTNRAKLPQAGVPEIATPTPRMVVHEPEEDDTSSSDSEFDSPDDDSMDTPYTTHMNSTTDLTNKGGSEDLISRVIQVIAKEIGVAYEEMQETSVLKDLGVDSMMIISLVSEIKKVTGLELAATFLNDLETVADVRKALINEVPSAPPQQQQQQLLQPKPQSKSKKQRSEKKHSKSAAHAAAETPQAAPPVPRQSVSQAVMAVIADETGTPLDEMDDSQALDSIGVDSIMVINIVDRVKKVVGVQIPATIFRKASSIGAIRAEIESGWDSSAPSVPEPPKEEFHDLTKKKVGQQHVNTPAAMDHPHTNTASAKAILIQGKPSSGSTPVFCLPDGSGSAASYIYIPQFSSQALVYALESPYSRNPSEFQCSIEDMAVMLIAAIREVQPEGPYILAGWSAGGVFAYEVARMLLESGQRVAGFIVIDTRAPEVLAIPEDAPLDIVRAWVADLMSSSGFTEAFTPRTKVGGHSTIVAEHISQTAAAMALYQAIPMKPHNRPDQCFVLWAERGILDDPDNNGLRTVPPKLSVTFEDPALQYWYGLTEDEEGDRLVRRDPLADWWTWFCEPRQEFGTNGWERYIGDAETYRIAANHFSIMEPPQVSQLGLILDEIVQKCG